MINPVDEYVCIVAMAVSEDVHVPPEDPFEVNVVVPLEHIACVPLIVPAFGAAVIMTVRVAVALGQASSPNTV